MSVRPGARLRSAASSCEVVIVRAPNPAGPLLCCGAEMTTEVRAPGQAEPEGEQIALGKRYTVADTGLEVLCVAAGAGPLTHEGQTLAVQGAKALPASD